MGVLNAFLGQGWVSSLIGIVGLIIALFLYRVSRIGARPVYQLRALRLIGKEKQILPEEVEILFRGRSIPRLTLTHVILWNSGKATLDGKNIIVDDPLRVEFRERTEILRVRVLKITRKANKFTAKINSDSPNQVVCNFDYLDAGDGGVIEILHTAEELHPQVRGSIRGVPKGLLDWGCIPSGMEFVSVSISPNLILFIILLFGGIMIVLGVTSPRIPEYSVFKPFNRWVFLISGSIFIIAELWMRWDSRRRFPKSLMFEDIE
jgi:hypothetical protein